jgi:hypothetical protein
MSVLVLDAGNSIIKAKIARRDRSEIAFPHTFKPLTEAEYTSILSRAGKQSSMQDYVRINGQPYVIGESAERHGVHTQRTGSSRYTRDYYGVFAAAMLGRFYERSIAQPQVDIRSFDLYTLWGSPLGTFSIEFDIPELWLFMDHIEVNLIKIENQDNNVSLTIEVQEV